MSDELFFPELPKIDKVLRAVSDLGAFNPSDGAGWELRKLRWYRDALFEHFAPFKVGDLIVMHTAYEIPAGSGWRGYEEMMRPGATGIVREVDWTSRELWNKDAERGDGCFSISVRFDHEFRVDNHWHTKERRVFEYPEGKRSLFWFNHPERHWKKVEVKEEDAATAA